jgi:hypothetical protein
MSKNTILWIIALAITLASAVYQRLTGPSYPLRGSTKVGGETVKYRLIRSHGGGGDAVVRVEVPPGVTGTLAWKRFKTNDEWTYAAMQPRDGAIEGTLPRQPAAGKLMYRVILTSGPERVTLAGSPVVIRFRGGVPLPVLVVHVIAMFGGMLAATRAGVERWSPSPNYRPYVLWTLGLIGVGGLILGPVVQKYAFGAYWTGWPLGSDLTDNKTAVAWLAWVVAWLTLKRPAAGWWVFGAAVVTLAVFLVPHSLFGSELKYE